MLRLVLRKTSSEAPLTHRRMALTRESDESLLCTALAALLYCASFICCCDLMRGRRVGRCGMLPIVAHLVQLSLQSVPLLRGELRGLL